MMGLWYLASSSWSTYPYLPTIFWRKALSSNWESFPMRIWKFCQIEILQEFNSDNYITTTLCKPMVIPFCWDLAWGSALFRIFEWSSLMSSPSLRSSWWDNVRLPSRTSLETSPGGGPPGCDIPKAFNPLFQVLFMYINGTHCRDIWKQSTMTPLRLIFYDDTHRYYLGRFYCILQNTFHLNKI